MPACATRYAGSPAISAPRKRTDPALGRSAPATRLKRVLLPEPFGPMRPRNSPSATSKETPFTAVNPPKVLVSFETSKNTSGRERVALRERQHRVGGLDLARPGDARAAVDVLHHHREGTLVLAGEPVSRRIELDAIALQRAADRDVGLERSEERRVGVEAAVFPDGARQHVGEEDPGVVEAHRDVRRQLARPLHRLVAAHHLLDE